MATTASCGTGPGPSTAASPATRATSSLRPEPNLAAVAGDLACLATLGTEGCGWGQHFAAVRRALTAQAEGENAGFLRGGSLLAIVIVSDQDDCSIRTDRRDATDIFNTQNDMGPTDLRCFNHPDYLEPVETFVGSLLALRPAQDLVVAAVVGIPPSARQVCTLGDMGESDYRCVLDQSGMQEVIDESPECQGGCLVTSCYSDELGKAFPPRRIVELVRQVDQAGGAGILETVCDPPYAGAFTAIGRAVAARIGGAD